jgi:hypothetical protein
MPRRRRVKVKRNTSQAKAVLQLLRDRHADDVFVSECKNGPTHIADDLQILDAWVMRKSWAHPLIIGYEIKVARSDFMQDTKWQGYLKWCNEFYFVCPSNVIRPEELPPEVGLIWCSKNMTRLFSKRKAVYRQIDSPDALFRYILMARARITRDQQPKENNIAYWKKWMKQREGKLLLGRSVSRRLNKVVDEQIDKVARENKRLKTRSEELEEIRELLHKLGIDSDWISSYAVERRIAELQGALPKGLESSIKRTISALENFQQNIQKFKGEESG